MRDPIHVWDQHPQFFRGLARVRNELERYLENMPESHIEQSDDRVYYTDGAGVR